MEFAIAGPVLFMLLLGVIDFGRALFAYDLLGNAARLGARYAVVRGTTCAALTPAITTPCPAANTDVAAYIHAKSPGISGLTVTTTWGPGVGISCPSPQATYQDPGCLVTVTVSYAFKFVMFPGLSIPMHNQSKMTMMQ